VEKKDYIIIILSLIIIGLIFIIFSGRGKFETIIEQIQGQRISAIRSNEIIESELEKSRGYNTQLEADNIELERDNTELESIVDRLTAGSKETEYHLAEYGNINSDFAEFIQANGNTE